MGVEAKNMEKKRMQKLELTWVGKDEPIVVEPCILIEDSAKSIAQGVIVLGRKRSCSQ